MPGRGSLPSLKLIYTRAVYVGMCSTARPCPVPCGPFVRAHATVRIYRSGPHEGKERGSRRRKEENAQRMKQWPKQLDEKTRWHSTAEHQGEGHATKHVQYPKRYLRGLLCHSVRSSSWSVVTHLRSCVCRSIWVFAPALWVCWCMQHAVCFPVLVYTMRFAHRRFFASFCVVVVRFSLIFSSSFFPFFLVLNLLMA